MNKTYHKNADSPIARPLKGDYGLHNDPTMQAIGKIVKTFAETRVVRNIEMPMYYRFARSVENIAMVSESVSIPRRSQDLELSYGKL